MDLLHLQLVLRLQHSMTSLLTLTHKFLVLSYCLWFVRHFNRQITRKEFLFAKKEEGTSTMIRILFDFLFYFVIFFLLMIACTPTSPASPSRVSVNRLYSILSLLCHFRRLKWKYKFLVLFSRSWNFIFRGVEDFLMGIGVLWIY